MLYKITNPFPNFNGTRVEVNESISNFIFDVTLYVVHAWINATHGSKGVPKALIFVENMLTHIQRINIIKLDF